MNKQNRGYYVNHPKYQAIHALGIKHAKELRKTGKELEDLIDIVPINIKDEYSGTSELPTSQFVKVKFVLSQELPDHIRIELLGILHSE